jgi:cephalosporin-C deacetylase-like acetyl esterase
LALIQLVNKVTELEAPPKTGVSKPEVSKPETQPTLPGNTENTDKQQPMPHTSTPKCKDQEIQKIIDKYATVFVGECKLNTQQLGLHINENIKPVVQPQRRIPYHIRNDVSKASQKGGTRICVDMRAANQAIKRERHIMPTLSDFRAELNGSKYFSKIDLIQAYHQLELKEESRYITTFSTHEGLFSY